MVLLKVIRITIITVRLTLSGHDGDFEHLKKMCIDLGPPALGQYTSFFGVRNHHHDR